MTTIRKIYLLLAAHCIVLGFSSIAMNGDVMTDAEYNQLMVQMPSDQQLQDMIKDVDLDDKNEIKQRNLVDWSIPAAFPIDKFNENVDKLHINHPFGRYNFSPGTYTRYMRLLEEVKRDFGLRDLEDSLRDGNFFGLHGNDLNNDFRDTFAEYERWARSLPGGNNQAANTITQSLNNLNNIHGKRMAIPGATLLYDFLAGRNLPGLGLYRSDLNEIVFLIANIASGYHFFKDIKKAKLDKIKASLDEHKDELIALLTRLAENTDKKQTNKIKQEIKAFVTRRCALFAYNPVKKEIVIPLLKYIVFQRIAETIRIKKNYWSSDPDVHAAFVKNERGELVRSGVTPISLVTIAKFLLTPMTGLSETTSELLQKTGRSLRFMDNFLGRYHLPALFYKWFTSAVGEALVLTLVIKIMDGYFNEQLTNAIIESPDVWLAALQKNKELDGVNELSPEQRAHRDGFESAIEITLSVGKTGFGSWLLAQRNTFIKISAAGFLFFAVPSLVAWLAPIIKRKLIN